MRLVAGLLQPRTGSVRVDGCSPAQARGRTAFVFQKPALLPWRTVAVNVGLVPELAGILVRERAGLVAARLALVRLSDAAAKYPQALSGGTRMRASLVRALASDPWLLLLDEPFGTLDEISRQRLGGELLRLRSRAVGRRST